MSSVGSGALKEDSGRERERIFIFGVVFGVPYGITFSLPLLREIDKPRMNGTSPKRECLKC